MSTEEPRDGDAERAGEPSPKRRNPWIWVSVVLALVGVGLLIWALALQSDLNSTEQQVDELQSQLDQGKEAGSTAASEAKSAYDDLTAELGATQEDLAATEQELNDAKDTQAKAEQDAAEAEQKAADAKNASEKASAEAEQAKAEAQAAESKATIVVDCAKAYLSSLGALFEGESPQEQAAAVREQLAGITADCEAALESA
jgi:uncharacterized protein (DUF3084 family)